MMPASRTAKPAHVTIRDAEETDLEAIRSIYNHYVLNSTATFEIEEQSSEARRQWWDDHRRAALPVLVAEIDECVVGWASLSLYHSRCAYRQTVEASIYIDADHLGLSLGRQLMGPLMAAAEAGGCHVVILGACSENHASLEVARDFGFSIVGTFKEVGRKFDRWLDVTVAQKVL